jgi:fucose permease
MAGGRLRPGAGVLVLWMGLLLFLYVGAEVGLGAWVASFAEKAAGAGVFEGAVITSLYWGALAAGRFGSDRAFRRGVNALSLLLVCCLSALAASSMLVAGGATLVVGGAAALLTGLAFGPVWPAALSAAARRGGADISAALVTAGNAGGVAIPWLQGRVLTRAGPEQGMALTAALCGAMVLIVPFAQRREARS